MTRTAQRPRLEMLETRAVPTAGGIDRTFGLGGAAVAGFTGAVEGKALAAAAQPDGKLLVLASATTPADPGVQSTGLPAAYRVYRYTAAGLLDGLFGSAGKVDVDLGTNGLAKANGVAVGPDGKIVVFGQAADPAVSPYALDFILRRYTPAGSFDGSFGTGGKVVTSVDPNRYSEEVDAVVFQADGKLIAVGHSVEPEYGWGFNVIGYKYHAELVRYNAYGTLDPTFGTGGKFRVADFSSVANSGDPVAAALQADGKIIVATGKSNSLFRVTAAGALDTSFGTDGRFVVDFGDGSTEQTVRGLALEPAGIVVLASGLQSTPGYGLERVTYTGALDTSFGSGGRVLSDVGAANPAGFARDADGRLLVGSTRDHAFALARYSADGATDATFGTNGLVVTAVPDADDQVAALAVRGGQPTLVGSVQGTGAYHDVALVRYNPDGTPDATFGQGGIVRTPVIGSTLDIPAALAVGPDGKVVEVGNNGLDFAVARFTANGALDNTYGQGGRVSTDFNHQVDKAMRVVIQADGKVVVAGTTASLSGVIAFALTRYNPDGTPDTSFGAGGAMTLSVQGGVDTLAGIFSLSGGRVLLAGSTAPAGSTHNDLILARFQADGTPDTSFGSGGTLLSPAGVGIKAADALLQPDGKLLVAGTADPGAFSVTRFNPDGTLDTSFGAGGTPGRVVLALGNANSDQVHTLALAPDGKIVLGGGLDYDPKYPGDYSGIPIYSAGLARLNPDGSLDPMFGTGGKWKSLYDGAVDDLVIQPDGKLLFMGDSQRGSEYLRRLHPDGAADATFGYGSYLFPDYTARALTLLPDGNFLAAARIFPSVDFAVVRGIGKASPNEHFVGQVYEDLLKQHADTVGLHQWADALDHGYPRPTFVAAVMQTDVYRAVIARSYYVDYLHREPDAQGLAAVVGMLRAGVPANQVKILFVTSGEYFQTRGGGMTDGYLAALYQDLLGRPIDTAGKQAYTGALAAGVPRGPVAAAILASPEANAGLVGALYFRFLHRPADPGGLAFFTNLLQHGATGESVLATLVASDEYFRRL